MAPVTRPLTVDDAGALLELYSENRQFLAPFRPVRPESYYTETGQLEALEGPLAEQAKSC